MKCVERNFSNSEKKKKEKKLVGNLKYFLKKNFTDFSGKKLGDWNLS